MLEKAHEKTICYLFSRQLVSSDPIISEFDINRRLNSSKKKCLPSEVRNLLFEDSTDDPELEDFCSHHEDTNDLDLEVYCLLDDLILEQGSSM